MWGICRTASNSGYKWITHRAKITYVTVDYMFSVPLVLYWLTMYCDLSLLPETPVLRPTVFLLYAYLVVVADD